MKRVDIRPYRPSDRAALRRICADTGFLGQPIDPVFEDRELFADYLTDYYLRFEPGSTLVCEVDGTVMGYLMGCRRPLAHQVFQILGNLRIATRAIYRSYRRPYGRTSRAFMHWIAFNAWREVPAAPRLTPHFHLNLLPAARGMRSTRLLIQAFLDIVRESGHRRVYGQMVTFESRRNDDLFRRYGFRVAARSEISKYRELHAERVFLATLVKDLSGGARLIRAPSREAR